MECPHCLKSIYVKERVQFSNDSVGIAVIHYAGYDGQHHWWLETIVCPACHGLILSMVFSGNVVKSPQGQGVDGFPDEATEQKIPVWPRHTGRPPVPPEVPDEFKRDYQEACLVLADSPNASAALSRRCLQFILREKLGAQGKDLYNEIDWTIKSGNLPSSTVDLLDVPGKIGNRAAHPMLSDAGMIVDVEPWEAEWCLEVIEALYDHIFVLPARNSELERLGRALQSGAVAGSSGLGRTVQLHPQEALLQQARALQQSEAFAGYRQRRVVVERRLARLVQLGIRQARYFGRVKTKFQLYLAATVANLTLVASKAGLPEDTGGASKVGSALRAGTIHSTVDFIPPRLCQIWALALLTSASLPKLISPNRAFRPGF